MQAADGWGDKGKGIQSKVIRDADPKGMTDKLPTQVAYEWIQTLLLPKREK